MTSQQILHADLLDILFEKRNKLYGAYQLRKEYPQQLAKAVGIALASALLLACFLYPSAQVSKMESDKEKVVVVEQVIPLPEQRKPEPPKAQPAEVVPVRQQTFIDKIVIVEKDVPTEMPMIDDLIDAAVSSRTTNGENAGAMQPPQVSERVEAEGTRQSTEAAPQKDIVPDLQPQFPGGMQAWVTFLSRNLHSPQDLDAGETRTVLISFHVAEDGGITNFQVLQSAGSAFDNEVIRVLKKMPKWTPAKKGGLPVPVSFTQPVTFVGTEE